MLRPDKRQAVGAHRPFGGRQKARPNDAVFVRFDGGKEHAARGFESRDGGSVSGRRFGKRQGAKHPEARLLPVEPTPNFSETRGKEVLRPEDRGESLPRAFPREGAGHARPGRFEFSFEQRPPESGELVVRKRFDREQRLRVRRGKPREVVKERRHVRETCLVERSSDRFPKSRFRSVGEVVGERARLGRPKFARRLERGTLALMVAAAALLVCIGLGLGPVVAVVVVLLAFVTTIMSAQSVGQTGIDPMEIFGLIVLLAVAAFSSASQVQLFYVAGVVAVACGLAGDVMSDFKTGAIIGTSPRAMWVGQAIGALLGTVVAVAVLVTLFSAYGPGAFGSGQMFVSAQASVVATMVSGIPSVPGFVIGLLGGIALYWAGLPAMMFGLGVYLPFYMSLTAALGAGVRWVYERVCAARGVEDSEEKGVVVASGVLGGESIVGVVIALASVVGGLAG